MIDVAAGAAAGQRRASSPARQLGPDDIAVIIGAAGRAPSVHNTQPWRFAVRQDTVDLLADRRRMLRIADPDGRELVISCGAALYGMRLGMRKLGYVPEIELLPGPAGSDLLASVRAGSRAATTREERELLAALPHRHTHRGPFDPGPVGQRLLRALCADAAGEGVRLDLIEHPAQLDELARLALLAAEATRSSGARQAEVGRWLRPPAGSDRDGIVARSWSAVPVHRGSAGQACPEAGLRLPQRDFGRAGLLPAGGSPPSATAVLCTPADAMTDWLAAGQALHRLLLRAATRWVFASLYTEPLEIPQIREQVRARLGIDGMPQLLLQFGRANTTAATARRQIGDVLRAEKSGSGPSARSAGTQDPNGSGRHEQDRGGER